MRQRSPLPPLPDGDYTRDLPWEPPRVRDFLRGDAWGVTLPGLPYVPGASTRPVSCSRVLTWFLDRYPPDWQHRILRAHAQRGYTHFLLSVPDSVNGAGFSIEQFRATCLLVRSYRLFVAVWLTSKYFQPHDMSAVQFARAVDPWLDALDGAVDEYMPCGELNLWNVPGRTSVDICRYVGRRAHAQGATCWLHFSTHYTSWFADGDPRGRYGFWDDLGEDVDGINYQTDPAWSEAELQGRIRDTTIQFRRQGSRHKFRCFEDQASAMFDAPYPDEDRANQRGYVACCTGTEGADPVWGYGNGGRRPDGTPL